MKSASNLSAIKLGMIAVAMFGFGYVLVPLYDMLCDITGLNGKSQSVTEQQQQTNFEVDELRTVTVEFVTSLNQGMSWDFKPATIKMQVHPGKPYQTSFFVNNKTNRSITGQAIPSIAPSSAASFFIKTECFCFTNQLLEAGQSMEMPVVFVINPALPEHVKTVTLSYTYFDVSNTVSKSSNNIDNT
jgi:cytochrome c oxidase assembly protein subunit 11